MSWQDFILGVIAVILIFIALTLRRIGSTLQNMKNLMIERTIKTIEQLLRK